MNNKMYYLSPLKNTNNVKYLYHSNQIMIGIECMIHVGILYCIVIL